VVFGLRRVSPTCLERALVVQQWLAAHGDIRDVVIGVQTGSGGLDAHAWIDGHEPMAELAYNELHRIPAP
jgi:hypothetical protein